MARYLVVIVVLAALGIVLVALKCDVLDEPSYDVEVQDLRVHTETIHLTGKDSSSSYAVVNFSFKGLALEDGKGVVVERKNGDFLIKDTLTPLSTQMSFTDPETLDVGRPVTYRLLLLNQGRVFELDGFTCIPFEGIKFDFSDTVLAEDGKVTLAWNHIEGIREYEVRLMTLGALAPLPQGEVVAKKVIKPSGEEEIGWEINVAEFESPASYILQVNASLEDEGRSIRGSRLFVLEGLGEEEENH
jgi:hypothetical protein